MKIFRKYIFLDGEYKGQIFKVYYSNHKTKKYQVNVGNKIIYHGAKGYSVAPGTNKGNRYCSRSENLSIVSIYSPNFWSRLNWSCIKNRTTKSDLILTQLGKVKIIA